MRNYRRLARLLAVLLAVAMGIGTGGALAEGEYRAVVATVSMSVYAQKSPHELLGALPRGTEVDVTAVSGEAALIRWNGRTGVARASELTPVKDAAEETGRTMVAARATRVYRRADTSSRYASVSAGTELTLLAVNGNCARVRLNGQVGYAVYSHLGEPGTAETRPAETIPAADATVSAGNIPVVTIQAATVCASADGTGGSVTVPKGAKLTLLAVKGECAMVSRNGAIGYMQAAYLQKDGSGAASAAPKAANPFPADSNEHAIYAFLLGEMGYNRAAAMGVMANIKYESGYRPTEPGDGGTSYGICQWHAGRKSNLIAWCEENGLDHTQLEPQLRFMKYELTTRYPAVHSYLKQVENSAEGAYDAGYYFCFNFEAPAARTSQSAKRGAYARDTLFSM